MDVPPLQKAMDQQMKSMTNEPAAARLSSGIVQRILGVLFPQKTCEWMRVISALHAPRGSPPASDRTV